MKQVEKQIPIWHCNLTHFLIYWIHLLEGHFPILSREKHICYDVYISENRIKFYYSYAFQSYVQDFSEQSGS